MNLPDAIQVLQVKSPKATESKIEMLSRASSKVYEGETDKELEDQISRIRSQFFGTQIHRVDLQRNKETQVRKKSKLPPTEDETKEKLQIAKLMYACSKPAPVYELSTGKAQVTQAIIYSDYFDLAITGHDVSSHSAEVNPPQNLERDRQLSKLLQTQSHAEIDQELYSEVQHDLIEDEFRKLDEEVEKVRSQRKISQKNLGPKKTIILSNNQLST